MKIQGRELINLEKDGYIYIYQKDYNQVKLQEEENGEISIDVSEIFKNAKRWKWGIYTDSYYSVLLSAISFKIPRLVLNVPNALVSIKKTGGFISINALIFAKKKELAFKYANEFKKANRDYVAFELSQDYREYDLGIDEDDVQLLLSDIVQEIKQIKERTEKIERETASLSFDTKFIKQYLEKIENKFISLEKQLQELKNQLEGAAVKKEREEDVVVKVVKEEGVYKDGEKVYLDIVGSVFDYLDIDKSFYHTFRIREIKPEIEVKLKELIKEKYFKNERFIEGEELRSIGLKNVEESKRWRISFIIKERVLKEAVSIFSSLLKEGKEEIERAFKDMLREAVKNKKEISVSDIEQRLSEKAKKEFNKLKEKFKGKKVDLDGDFYIVANNDVEKLMLFSIVLDAERNKKKVVIK